MDFYVCPLLELLPLQCYTSVTSGPLHLSINCHFSRYRLNPKTKGQTVGGLDLKHPAPRTVTQLIKYHNERLTRRSVRLNLDFPRHPHVGCKVLPDDTAPSHRTALLPTRCSKWSRVPGTVLFVMTRGGSFQGRYQGFSCLKVSLWGMTTQESK